MEKYPVLKSIVETLDHIVSYQVPKVVIKLCGKVI